MWNGKIFGLIVGMLLVPGPVGLVVGLLVGHLYDVGAFDQFLAQFGWRRRSAPNAQTQHLYFQTTFSIMGHIAKSDGRVSEKEIQYARSVMRRMGLNEKMSLEAMRLFNVGKQSGFDAHQAVETLKRAYWRQPGLLRNFLEIQIQCAMVDGKMTAAKREVLNRLYQQFGLRGATFDQYEQQSRARQNYQRYYQQQRPNHQSSRQHMNDAYDLLDINKTATDAEIKKAYRRMMSKHHPDKLMSQGMPPEMIKIATEKTQQVKQAYETIKQARGMQ